MPSYVDIEQISRLARVDEKTGKEMWDLMFIAVHEHNIAQVEKEFPTRERPDESKYMKVLKELKSPLLELLVSCCNR